MFITIAQNAQKEEIKISNDPQARKYQLTINNPKEHGFSHNEIHEILKNNFKTLIYYALSDECGTCYHTHLFLVFSSRVRVSTIHRNFEGAHIEIARGSISDNINYLKKEGKWKENKEKHEKRIEGTFEEYGTRPPDSQGKRTDMSELYQYINDGLSNAEILALNQDYILNVDKLDKVRNILLTNRFKEEVRLDLQVIYISGATGTGKTRGVFEKDGYVNTFRVTDYAHPFDAYCCQETIVFDEFRNSLKLSEMLNYLDIYPVDLPSRYNNKVACYRKVYIISNWKLEQQYSYEQINDRESYLAFLRRIHKVVTYKDNGEKVQYNSVEEYLNRGKERE